MVVINVGDTSVMVEERPYGLAVEGAIGPLDVVDVMKADGVTAASGAKDIVGSSGVPVGLFRYRQWLRGTPVYPGHDGEIYLRGHALSATFNELALLWLVRPPRAA